MKVFTFHDRITSTESGDISWSVFQFLNFDSGAAIKISSPNFALKIDSSLFRFCLSNSHGGAIYLQGMKTSINRTCFDACFKFGGKDDNVFGNAIFSQLSGSSSEPSCLNQAAFFGCGPTESAGDSTVYYDNHPLESESLNFSQCSGYGGSVSISAKTKNVKSKFLSTYGGKSWVLIDTFSDASMDLQKMNSLNYTQTSGNFAVFNGFHYDVTDCCLFFCKMPGRIGDVTFKGNCYCNINIKYTGLAETQTTEFVVPKIIADDYCQYQKFSAGNIIPCFFNISLFLLLEKDDIFIENNYAKEIDNKASDWPM